MIRLGVGGKSEYMRSGHFETSGGVSVGSLRESCVKNEVEDHGFVMVGITVDFPLDSRR